MNYAELSMAISDWLNKDSLDKIMPTIIRFGQRDLEDNLRIRPMEYHPTTASISAGEDALALPSDFLELIYLEFFLDNTDYPVEIGLARIADEYVFDVPTTAIYTRDWCYYRRLPTLVASAAGTPPGNSNWWSENAEEAFLMSCLNKSSLYVSGITEGDKKKWAEAYALNLERLRFREARETTGGNVLRSSNWK